MASGPTNLESAIETLVRKFYDYAKKTGKRDKMNQKEFREMVTQELPHVLTNTQHEVAVYELFQALAAGSGGMISFNEYWSLIANIAQKMSQQVALQ